MAKNKTERAAAYANRLFSIRPRSERELRDRLCKKGFDRTTVSAVVSSLKARHVIDDSRFARLWVESRMRAHPKGAMLLRKELREKGISTAIIEQAVSDEKGKEDSIVRSLAVKKSEQFRNLPRERAKKKLFEFLARRGFDFDAIEKIVQEIFGC